MLKRIACLLFVFTFCLTACDGKKESDPTNYSVEYGQSFTLPKIDGQKSVTVTDESGKEVETQFGSFKPAVGKYKVKYTLSNGSKTVDIECRDTLSPEIVFSAYTSSVETGKRVEIPRYKVTDYSKLKTESVAVYRADGSEVTVDSTGGWTTENDVYTIVVKAEDIYGNSSELSTRIVARSKYTDSEKGANVLYSFDDDKYINLVYEADGVKNFNADIVREGYPEIVGEAENNGVLKLETKELYDDVYAKFVLLEEAKTSQKGGITLRVLLDKAVDYLKIQNCYGVTVKSFYELQANVWYELKVNPLEYNFGANYEEFYLYARAVNGLCVYVDEILYEGVWTDDALETGTIADFDEAGYLNRVYENSDNGVLGCVGGTFSIEKYPFGNHTVLKIDVEENYQGITYLFDEPIEVARIESVTIVLDCPYFCETLYVGAYRGDYRGEKYLQISEAGTKYGKIQKGNLYEYCISTDAFWEQACGDGLLTGIWLGFFIDNRPCTAYLDEIRVEYWY